MGRKGSRGGRAGHCGARIVRCLDAALRNKGVIGAHTVALRVLVGGETCCRRVRETSPVRLQMIQSTRTYTGLGRCSTRRKRGYGSSKMTVHAHLITDYECTNDTGARLPTATIVHCVRAHVDDHPVTGWGGVSQDAKHLVDRVGTHTERPPSTCRRKATRDGSASRGSMALYS